MESSQVFDTAFRVCNIVCNKYQLDDDATSGFYIFRKFCCYIGTHRFTSKYWKDRN